MFYPQNYFSQMPPAFSPSAGGMGKLPPPLAPRRRYVVPMGYPSRQPGSAPPPPPAIPPFLGLPSRNERQLIDFLNPIYLGPGSGPTYF